MNLVSDPWIPVVLQDGASARWSLSDVFARAREARDLAVRPDERVALMRLLICIAQAALNGPEDHQDWQGVPETLPGAAKAYLNAWRPHFELFGNGPRFLQVASLSLPDEKWTPASKLDFALATGNNPTLFDNGGGEERSFSPDQLALRLLAFQCFSPGGRIGVAEWNGQSTPGNGSSEHAPCLSGSMAHAYIRGGSLLESIHLNLLTRELIGTACGRGSWGKPIWEQFPAGPADNAAQQNASRTYVGRLVPLSRAILLSDDGCRMILANGISYPSLDKGGPREVAATVVVRKAKGKEDYALLPLRQDGAIWRELHSLLVRRKPDTGVGGPLALQNLSEEQAFDLWVGGMIADQAKPLDLLESVFHIPKGMLHETHLSIYEKGVALAQQAAEKLEESVAAYGRELARPAGSNAGRAVDTKSIRSRVLGLYWSAIENAVPALIEQAAHAMPEGWGGTAWGRKLRAAAIDSFTASCPSASQRQLRAFAFAAEQLQHALNQLLS